MIRLAGLGVNGGRITAPIYIAVPGISPSEVPLGCILACKTTSPTLLPHILRAVGLVTEIGDELCHAAIVGRELGLPTVVGVSDLLTTVNIGMLMALNGEDGTLSTV